jgi:hypothetical protein
VRYRVLSLAAVTSWDIIIMDLPADARSISGISHDFRPVSIGRRQDLIRAVQHVVSDADFSDPSWGAIDGNGYIGQGCRALELAHGERPGRAGLLTGATAAGRWR